MTGALLKEELQANQHKKVTIPAKRKRRRKRRSSGIILPLVFMASLVGGGIFVLKDVIFLIGEKEPNVTQISPNKELKKSITKKIIAKKAVKRPALKTDQKTAIKPKEIIKAKEVIEPQVKKLSSEDLQALRLSFRPPDLDFTPLYLSPVTSG